VRIDIPRSPAQLLSKFVIRNEASYAEVSQADLLPAFNLFRALYQYVLRLDISVYYVSLVKLSDRQKQLLHYMFDLVLREPLVRLCALKALKSAEIRVTQHELYAQF